MGDEGKKTGGTRRCPFCAEEILAAARKCKHCGSMLDEDANELTQGYSQRPAQVTVGQTLNQRYVVSRRLARGGMAEIFLGRDLELDMDVALKVIPPSLADDPRLIKHLREEARITIQLTHQNIVRVYSFDASGEIKFIVMEFVSGKNLYQLVNETPESRFSAEQVVGWLLPVCDALGYAHSLGVVHRDIKPSNIMVTEEGLIKVADFGIARRFEQSVNAVSQHTVRGTPNYMSPEQLRGENLSVLSDIYSLGATVYMLLSGRPVFNTAVIAASRDRPPPEPIVGIPPRLFRAILRSLEMDPHRRPQNAMEFYMAAKNAFDRSGTQRLPIIAELGAADTTAELPGEQDAEEVPIRVEAEELPGDLDAVTATLREKALKALEEGKLEKAALLYVEFAAMAPENPEAWCGLGDSRVKSGDRAGAIDAYRKALKIEYDNIYARFQIGLAYEQLGEPERAVKEYQQAVKIVQENPSLHLEKSLTKLKRQIQSVQWKVQQAEDDRRRKARELREQQERERRRVEERRRKAIRAAIIIVLVIVLLAIGLGVAEHFFSIFQYLPL